VVGIGVLCFELGAILGDEFCRHHQFDAHRLLLAASAENRPCGSVSSKVLKGVSATVLNVVLVMPGFRDEGRADEFDGHAVAAEDDRQRWEGFAAVGDEVCGR
jgi:hypothetical protein